MKRHTMICTAILAMTGTGLAGSGVGSSPVCYSDTIPLASTDWQDQIVLPLFNPADGLLEAIHVTASVHLEGSVGVESQDQTPTLLTSTVSAIINVLKQDSSPWIDLSPSTSFNDPVGPYDGTNDFGGTSGVMHGGIVLDESVTVISPPDPLDFNDFIGTGNFALPVFATGSSSVTGAGNFLASFSTDVSVTVQICYYFAADCNGNGIPDHIDIANGTSYDDDDNGIPDECEAPVDLGCDEFDRYATLTPNDTFTVLTVAHNPDQAQGYVVVVATDLAGEPIGFDYLIGQQMVLSGIAAIDYGVNAIDYRAAVAHGAATDIDSDGVRDLDGLEYEMTPAQLLVPKFVAIQNRSPLQRTISRGQLILLALSGGTDFDVTVDVLAYNDNEETFSGEHTFNCWDKIRLDALSNLFLNDFLTQFTTNDPTENLAGLETGWFRLDGGVASSGTTSYLDPAFYAVHIDRVDVNSAVDLPFEIGAQAGHLLPTGLLGDNSEAAGTQPATDPLARIQRRQPGSLLIFPEFNNRQGWVSVLTVSNTHAFEPIRVHYVYYGKYANQP